MWFFLCLTGVYALAVLVLWYGWRKNPVAEEVSGLDEVRVSVIVPVRNEAQHIEALLGDLCGQRHPHWEALVVDDHSTDGTADLVRAFAARHPDRAIRLLERDDRPVYSPKKAAISLAIGQARGQLVVTTDGDCRVGPDWLAVLVGAYVRRGAKVLSAPVAFGEQSSLFEWLQTVEFASLIGTGGASLALGSPNMANGANLAYDRAAFEEMGGFEGTAQVASGDDEFLLHKFHARWPGSALFVRDPRAVVRTRALADWESFGQQRRRWASKWPLYQNVAARAVAIGVYLFHFATVLSILLCCIGWHEGKMFFWQYLIKFAVEYVFLSQVLRDTGVSRGSRYILLMSLLHPFYIVWMGAAGYRSGYVWKGRRLR